MRGAESAVFVAEEADEVYVEGGVGGGEVDGGDVRE